MSSILPGVHLYHKVFIVYLKFKFTWASCILSINPISLLRCPHSWKKFSCWSSCGLLGSRYWVGTGSVWKYSPSERLGRQTENSTPSVPIKRQTRFCLFSQVHSQRWKYQHFNQHLMVPLLLKIPCLEAKNTFLDLYIISTSGCELD